MSSMRSHILRQIFNVSNSSDDELLAPLTTQGSESSSNPSPDEAQLSPELPPVAVVNLRNSRACLDSSVDSYVNIGALKFNHLPEDGMDIADEPPLARSDQFLDTLDPMCAANKVFLYKFRRLQDLELEISSTREDYLAQSDDGHQYLSEFDDALEIVHTELEALLLAALEASRAQQATITQQAASGLRRYDHPHSARNTPPLAMACIILIAIIHSLMGVARNNCDFVLRFLRATLRLAYLAQESSARTYILRQTERIPTTLETSLQYQGLHSNLVLYACCPNCSALYAESGSTPDRCTWTSLDGIVCNSKLFSTQHRGTREWRRPRRRYSHQPLEVWLGRLLNRPGIEDLLECATPNLQAEHCDDVWNAPYLNSFPGNGEPSFFACSGTDLQLAFLVYFDFFNPFSNKMAGKQRSVGVIMMACLNLPPEIRCNRENVYTVSIIPGPAEPKGDEINHFLRPIVQNLSEHFDPGILIARTHKHPGGRHVRSAAIFGSMDLLASRSWGGLGSPSHSFFCSCCYITQSEIDNFNLDDFARRNMALHKTHVELWKNASSSAERREIWKNYAARHSEWLTFPWWDVFIASVIASMHWTKNILEKQLRDNMGWSTEVSTGIPSAPKSTKPISTLELNWGNTALQCCTASELEKIGLPEPLLRHLCNERHLFNAGLPSQRMIKDLNLWRYNANIIQGDGQLTRPIPAQGDHQAQNPVSVAKAEFYLSKAKRPDYLVRKSRLADLQYLCTRYGLSSDGTQTELAERLISYIKPFRPQNVEVPEECQESLAVLGKEVLLEVKSDMDITTIPSWLKAPPKNFGTSTHGKIGSEEYKSLVLVSLTITLIRMWGRTPTGPFRERLDHFLDLTIAIRILSYQSLSTLDIGRFQHHYTNYVRGLKTLYPFSTITPTQHLGLHIPEFLTQLGPATHFNENPAEMMIGMLQDVSTNWKFGDLELTLHREFVMVANLEALLQQSSTLSELDEIFSLIHAYMETPATNTGNPALLSKFWIPTHSSSLTRLDQETYDRLVTLSLASAGPIPSRYQYRCTKIQQGHLVYQPVSSSIGNSTVLFEASDSGHAIPGRILDIWVESILPGPNSSATSRVTLILQRFLPLTASDKQLDPYYNHPVIGASSGYGLVELYYDKLDNSLTYALDPHRIVSHVATCPYKVEHGPSAPAIVVVSLNLKHRRALQD